MGARLLETMVVFNGEKELAKEEVLNNPEYMSYWNDGCNMYHTVIDEIIDCGAYLFIDASDTPKYSIKNASPELDCKLRSIGLS